MFEYLEIMGVSSNVKVEDLEKERENVVNEDENELSLELSIGRKSYKKSNTLPQRSMGFDSSKMGFLDFTQENKPSVFPTPQLDQPMDPLLKREIQALRRQEARKKRDEKLKIKAISKGKNGIFFSANHEDAVVEDEAEMPPRKKEKNESLGNVGRVGEEEKQELMVKDLKHKMSNGSDPTGQAPYSYAMQYVPLTNGIVYPYGVMPSCWGSAVAANNETEKEKRVAFVNVAGGIEGPEKEKRVTFEVAGCPSFLPYSRKVEQNGNAKSDGSSGGSSSASDYQKPSLQGGTCSSKFPQEGRNATSHASTAGNVTEKSQNRYYDSKGMNSNEVKIKTKVNQTVNIVSSTNIQLKDSRCKEETKQAAPLKEPILITKNLIRPVQIKQETSNGVNRNPPERPTECNGASPLPRMPCVSTTGNGPNGKTITGFLCRYTKTEVNIVCVCHGTTFSPAEFVEHAGGVDVQHPLRHITIVPSASS